MVALVDLDSWYVDGTNKFLWLWRLNSPYMLNQFSRFGAAALGRIPTGCPANARELAAETIAHVLRDIFREFFGHRERFAIGRRYLDQAQQSRPQNIVCAWPPRFPSS